MSNLNLSNEAYGKVSQSFFFYTCELCDTVLHRKLSEHPYGSEVS